MPPLMPHAHAAGSQLPPWSVLPFATLLVAIAVLPLVAPHWWENNRHRGLTTALLGMPIVLWMGVINPRLVLHTAGEYASFMVLLSSLYVVSSGIYLRGDLQATPAANTLLLWIGSLSASILGTTGASMLLVRPLLRGNARRQHRAHTVVFFIFIVSNIGGLLTPLGDPPLFLGFLRGVPFSWTLRLWPLWAFTVGALLLVYYGVDTFLWRRENHHLTMTASSPRRATLKLMGAGNLSGFVAIIGIILVQGAYHLPPALPEAAMLLVALTCYVLTPPGHRQHNRLSWAPITEVAIIFAGIFATMMPALELLNSHGAPAWMTSARHYFWATGLLSSVLDNAPTYLTFTTAASALCGTHADNLAELLQTPVGTRLLTAISTGAVMMGANTYLGNGPNFMVKAVAEQEGVIMPSFFGYLAYSGAVLLPLFALVTLLFF